MDQKTENSSPEASPALVAAGTVVLGGALVWMHFDALLRPYVAAGYARTRPYMTAVDPTPAGWFALVVLVAGIVAAIAAGLLAWVLYDGNRTGWVARPVPVVPNEAVQLVAGCIAAALTLAGTLVVQLPAWMGLPLALIGGLGLGWAARDAATPWITRAVALDSLDRTAGFPSPGQSRIRRITVDAPTGIVTAIVVTTGPNFDPVTSLAAAVDRAAQCPALTGITFTHDPRRRLLIGESK